MVEFVAIKRPASYAGEVGLFPAAEPFEEAMSLIKNGTEADIQATVRGTERYIKFSHVIAKMVFDNTDIFASKEDARDALLIDSRHVRRRFDRMRGTAELIPKPTRNLDATEWLRLIKLMVYNATVNYGIPAEAFERETRAFMQQPEPPPHTEIPGRPMPTSAPAPQEHVHLDDGNPPPERLAEPARRDMDEEEPETPTEPKNSPPVAAAKPAPLPEREPITWTHDMPGEPDWRIDLPGDPPMYHAYAIAKLERTTDEASWLTWWNSDEEYNRRTGMNFGVMNKKTIEKLAAEKVFKT